MLMPCLSNLRDRKPTFAALLGIFDLKLCIWASLVTQRLKKKKIHLPMQKTQETQVQSLDQEDTLEEEMTAHSNILAWRIPWTDYMYW